MPRAAVLPLALLALAGCSARSGAVAAPSLLRLVTEPQALTLCEGMTRHASVSASWTGSTQPDVAGLPRIRWMSANPRVARVDSLTGGITALEPGTAEVVVHGRLGSEYGRAALPVTVRAGRQDERAWREARRVVCTPAP